MSVQFSIIIPTYNRSSLISEALTSILNQPMTSLEVIVVDDGSLDNTKEVLDPFLDGHRVSYHRTENQERGAARNFGLQFARGSYVNFFDSDDLFEPCLVELAAFIEANQFPAVIFGNIEYVGKDRGVEFRSWDVPNFKSSLLHNNFLACGSVFLRKDIAMEFPFSTDRALSGTEDWELWLRIYAKHIFFHFSRTIFKQRLHPARSLNQTDSRRVEERELSFIRHIETNRSFLQQRFSESEIDLLVADRYTLISLAFFEEDDRSKAKQFWIKSLTSSWHVVRRKRFWAISKKILVQR